MDSTGVWQGHWRMQQVANILLLLLNCAAGFYVQPDIVAFTLDPETTVTCLGCEVLLTCEVQLRETGAGLPQPVVTWERNGTEVTHPEAGVDITSERLVGPGWYRRVSYLKISDIQLHHAGEYRCMVRDGVDGGEDYCYHLPCIPTITASKTATLMVLESHSGGYQSVNVSTCGVSVLECGSIPAGLWSQVNFTWTRNGTDLDIDRQQDMKVLSNGALVVLSGRVVPTGRYECAVGFRHGDSGVVIARYDIQEGTEDEMKAGHKIFTTATYYNKHISPEIVCVTRLNCSDSEVVWTRDGMAIDMLSSYNGRVLSFSAYDRNASGLYCCEVDGLQVGCVEMQEIDLPVIEDNENSRTIFIDTDTTDVESIRISCDEVKDPAVLATTTWLHNGLPLTGSSYAITQGDLEITFDNSSALDVCGVYQCLVANQAGSSVSVKRILPKGYSNPPCPPTRMYIPRRRSAGGIGVRLQWCKPVYTAGLNASELTFKVEYDYNGPVITKETYLDVFLSSGSFIYATVAVFDESTNKNLSEEVFEYLQVAVLRSCNAYPDITLYPPVLSVGCSGSKAAVEWRNNGGNLNINPETYYLSGYCNAPGQYSHIQYDEEHSSSGSDVIGNLTVGTDCVFQAAVLPQQRPSVPQQCYSLELVEWSGGQCTVTAEVGFEHLEYHVQEDNGTVEVCIVSSGLGFTVNISTSQAGSAIAEADYSTTVTMLEFDPTSHDKLCTSVPILNDGAVEGLEERFRLELNTNSRYVQISQSNATVFIMDDDTVDVKFTQTTYSAHEDSGVVWVCVELEGEIDREVSVNVVTVDGTAKADTNYNSTIKELLFNETVHQICLEVTILRDDIVTTDTHFFVQLSSEDRAVNLSHDTRVLIANTDVPRFEFEEEHYQAAENNTVTVCVLLKEGRLGTTVRLVLTTINGSAIAGEDFTAIIPVTLTFDESIRENCVDIAILEDQLSEGIEVFQVLLSAYSDQPTVEFTENVSVEIVPNEVSSQGLHKEDTDVTTVVAVTVVSVVLVLAVLLVILLLVVPRVMKKKRKKRYQLVNLRQDLFGPDRIDHRDIVDPELPPWSVTKLEPDSESLYEPLDSRNTAKQASLVIEKKESGTSQFEHQSAVPHHCIDSREITEDQGWQGRPHKLSSCSGDSDASYIRDPGICSNVDSGNVSTEYAKRKSAGASRHSTLEPESEGAKDEISPASVHQHL